MPVTSVRRAARLAVSLALAGSALTMGVEAPALAAGPCELSVPFAPVAPNNVIPDGNTNTSTIDVPEDGWIVSDVDLAVDLHHSAVADLSITLESWDDAGVTPRASVTLFDDSATAPITAATAPFAGRFRPVQPLSALNGYAGGKYLVVLHDKTPLDGDGGGILDGLTLTLRYASCDQDADGVEDHVDACPDLGGDVSTGCPVASAHLGAAYRNGRFRGSLLSPVPGCRAPRQVTIWKVRPGPDRAVGTATTRSDGAYRLVRPRRPGRYYATSPAHLVPGDADCLPARSARFRLL